MKKSNQNHQLYFGFNEVCLFKYHSIANNDIRRIRINERTPILIGRIPKRITRIDDFGIIIEFFK